MEKKETEKMTEVTNELIYEILKKMQSIQSDQSAKLRELQAGQIRLEKSIHGLKGEQIHNMEQNADFQLKLERLQERLDITD